MATESFHRRHYSRRAWAQELVEETEEPDTAFDRWMQRDALFAIEVAKQARKLGYRVLVTDGRSSLHDHHVELDRILTLLHR